MRNVPPSDNTNNSSSPIPSILLPFSFMVVIGLYVLSRYGGFWTVGVDTARFTGHILSMLDENTLLPSLDIYPHGYAYQVFVLFLHRVSGMSVLGVQLIGSALLISWLVLPAWLLFREFTGTPRGAALAVLILLIQPEFIFPILRGTHEKFSRGLMLLCLFLLVRSLRSRDNLKLFTAFILSFYLSIYALIAFNSLLASSFILAVALSLLISWGGMRLRAPQTAPDKLIFQRLFFTTLAALILTFIFIFYIYTPARDGLFLLESIWEQISALLLDVEILPDSTAYQRVPTGWVSMPVYFTLSLANWLLLGVSALVWLAQTFRWHFRRQPSGTERALLLWSFYGAFALIGVVSVLSDISGFLVQNFQVRVFPSFAMLAAPLIAAWLLERRVIAKRPSRSIRISLGIGFALLALLSTLKATNEPLLSNRWPYFIPSEMQALDWSGGSLPGREVWTGYDDRLSTAFNTYSDVPLQTEALDSFDVDLGTRDILISEVTRLRSLRLELPLPLQADSLLTYDNGRTQIFHLRPRTPYQR